MAVKQRKRQTKKALLVGVGGGDEESKDPGVSKPETEKDECELCLGQVV